MTCSRASANTRVRRRARVFAALATLVGLSACTAPEERTPTRDRVNDRVEAGFRSKQILERSRLIAAADPAVHSKLWGKGTSFSRESDGRLTTQFVMAASDSSSGEFAATLPERANGTMRFRLGWNPAEVEVRFAAAHDVGAELEEGRVIYAGAYPATDVIWTADAARLEEFLLIRDATAPRRFEWNVATSSAVATTRRDAAGGLIFVDAQGRTLFRVPRPFAIDALGERREASVDFEGGTLSVALETHGLAYPILLDPAVEAVWEPVDTGAVPSARRRHALAYDSDRDRTVLFGGVALLPPQTNQYLCDTWELAVASGSPPQGTWGAVAAPGACPTSQGTLRARSSHAMTYDTANHRTLLFGGFTPDTGVASRELWEWDGVSWAQCVTAACTADGSAPAPRVAPGLAYDTGRRRAVLFGGAGSSAEFCDTWEWASDSRTWERVQNPASCDASATDHPAGRQEVAMAYDASRGVTVLFGGASGLTVFDDVWEWDGSGTWTRRCQSSPCVSTRPGPRQHGTFAFDSTTRRIVLFGGTNSDGSAGYDDTWLWNGSVWTSLGSGGPEGRSQHAMVFDASERRTLLFGGQSSHATGDRVLNDIWSLQTRGNDCTTNADCDTNFCSTETNNASVETKLCCNEACTGVCRACTQALKEDGSADGTCGVAKAGTDPHGSCAATSPTTCGTTGACAGNGTCALHSATTVCAPQSCSGSTVTPQRLCNGSGTCASGVPAACPGNFNCADGSACRTACTSDAHCSSGHFCNSVGACEAKKALGAQCPTTLCFQGGNCDRCNTPGGCVDGFCCESSCTTPCRNCGNTSGECRVVSGSASTGTDDPPQCAGTQTCSANGTCLKENGQSETNPANCASGFASDGHCCNAECAGPCNDCTTGTCTNVANGTEGVSGDCATTGYLCSGGVCPTTCTSDTHCTSDRFCDATGHCALRKGQGTACSPANDCIMGSSCRICSSALSCEDGVCCDTANCDDDECRACTAALKGSGTDGVCGVVAGGTDPRNRCPDPTDVLSCGPDGLCNDSGDCRAVAPNTRSCGATQCTTNLASVQGRLCTAGSCEGGAEQSCAPFKCVPNGSSGACGTSCTEDTQCAAGAFCTTGAMRVCKNKFALGAECGGNNECNSNFCVDGVCCADACDGECLSCANASGTCTTVIRDAEDDQCRGSRICDANGVCKLKQTSGDCTDDDECVTGNCVDGHCCADTCGTPCRSCNNRNGTCTTPVTGEDDDNCDGSQTCDADGACKLANGQRCSDADECASALCVDGVCCNAACEGSCEACDVEGEEGTCTLVEGEPHGERTACDGEPGSTCGGFCDGRDVDCTYPGGSERCGSVCTGERLVTQSCDGAGACVDNDPETCGLYACDEGAGVCLTTCTTNTDCAVGSACNESGSCVSARASCIDETTLRDADGVTMSCAPFKCRVDQCTDPCESIDDCAEGSVCDPSGRCVPRSGPKSQSDESMGCGCRQAPPPTGSGHALLALGLIGFFLARRRERAHALKCLVEHARH